MDFNFFILLVVAVALGVYIGRDPIKHINELIVSTFKVLPSAIAWVVLNVLIVGCLYYSFIFSYLILDSLNRSTTAPVPKFLIPVGAGFIAIIITVLLIMLMFNIKNLGFKKGILKTLKNPDSETPKGDK